MTLWQRSRAFRVTTWIVVAFAALFVLPWGYLYWRTERDLAAELQRIRDAGEPVSLADIVPPDVPDEQNAALVYARYYTSDNAGYQALSFGPIPDAKTVGTFLNDGSGEGQTRTIFARPEVAEVLDLIQRASHLPYAVGARTEDGGSSHAFVAASHAATWLGARAVLAARDGNREEALQWVAAIFGISRQMQVDPFA